jgi:hypothetical protein
MTEQPGTNADGQGGVVVTGHAVRGHAGVTGTGGGLVAFLVIDAGVDALIAQEHEATLPTMRPSAVPSSLTVNEASAPSW